MKQQFKELDSFTEDYWIKKVMAKRHEMAQLHRCQPSCLEAYEGRVSVLVPRWSKEIAPHEDVKTVMHERIKQLEKEVEDLKALSRPPTRQSTLSR